MRLPRQLRNPWVLFTLSLIFSIAAFTLIFLSIGDIQSRFAYRSALERLDVLAARQEFGDAYQRELREAARHARRGREWSNLFHRAWNLPEPVRWRFLVELGDPAIRTNPRDERWRILQAYGALRLSDRSTALTILAPIDPASPLVEKLRLLTAINAANPVQSEQRLGQLIADYPASTMFPAVQAALHASDGATYLTAWQETQAGVFLVNAALHMAAERDHESVRELQVHLERIPESDPGRVYLAAWLPNDEWLERQLRLLDRDTLFSPVVQLARAAALERTGRVDEAMETLREIRDTSPAASVIPFINETIFRTSQELPEPLRPLEDARAYHDESPVLRQFRAVYALRAGENETALALLDGLVEAEVNHNSWLLRRVIQFRSAPISGGTLERLQSDLWRYLNRNPDAEVVSAFLARLLAQRGDRAGLRELQRRYEHWDTPWMRATVLILDPEVSEDGALPPVIRSGTQWTDHYNRALFALRHQLEHNMEQEISSLRRFHERQRDGTPERRDRREADLLVLEAEMLRIQGNHSAALRRVDQAIRRDPQREGLYSFRALIEGHQ